jgi:hypothetical protein
MAAPEIIILLGSRDHELAVAKISYFGGAVVLDARIALNVHGGLWVAWGLDYHLSEEAKTALSARIIEQYQALTGGTRRSSSLAQLGAQVAKSVIQSASSGGGGYVSQRAPLRK